MSEPRTTLQRTSLKKETNEGKRHGEEQPERGSSFESVIPGDGRRHLFKRPKGKIGMG